MTQKRETPVYLYPITDVGIRARQLPFTLTQGNINELEISIYSVGSTNTTKRANSGYTFTLTRGRQANTTTLGWDACTLKIDDNSNPGNNSTGVTHIIIERKDNPKLDESYPIGQDNSVVTQIALERLTRKVQELATQVYNSVKISPVNSRVVDLAPFVGDDPSQEVKPLLASQPPRPVMLYTDSAGKAHTRLGTGTYRGAWLGTNQYQEGDTVTDNNVVYYALADNINMEPISNPTVWVLYSGVHSAASLNALTVSSEPEFQTVLGTAGTSHARVVITQGISLSTHTNILRSNVDIIIRASLDTTSTLTVTGDNVSITCLADTSIRGNSPLQVVNIVGNYFRSPLLRIRNINVAGGEVSVSQTNPPKVGVIQILEKIGSGAPTVVDNNRGLTVLNQTPRS